jgi:hypothetical protein
MANETLIFIAPVESALVGEVFDSHRKYRSRIESFYGKPLVERKHLEAPKWDPDLTHAQYKVAAALIEKSWFERAWVVQEVLLSKKPLFIIARQTFGLEELGVFFDDLGVVFLDVYVSLFMVSGKQRLDQMRRMKLWKLPDCGIGDLVYLLSDIAPFCQVTDQKDLVYAFLGLQHGFHIQVDYSLTGEVVFTNTAGAIITQTGNLALLGHIERDGNKKRRMLLPSWVPDWNVTTAIQPLSFLRESNQLSIFSACRSRLHITNTTKNVQNQLLIRGAVIDQVIQCLTAALPFATDRPENHWYHFLNDPTKNQAIFEAGCVPDIDKGRLLKVLLAEGYTYVRRHTAATTADFEGWKYENHAEELSRQFDQIKEGGNQQIGSVLHKASGALIGRMLFKGDADKYGLAPSDSKVGDLVCILHGSDVPVILRRGAGNTYTFIGQCYFEGCMYGEAVKWEEDEAEEFYLI